MRHHSFKLPRWSDGSTFAFAKWLPRFDGARVQWRIHGCTLELDELGVVTPVPIPRQCGFCWTAYESVERVAPLGDTRLQWRMFSRFCAGCTTLKVMTPVRFLAVRSHEVRGSRAQATLRPWAYIEKVINSDRIVYSPFHGDDASVHLVRMLSRQPQVFFMMFTTTTMVNATHTMVKKF